MQQISIVGHSGKYIGLSSEALMSSKLKPAKLACPPNSNIDKCAAPKLKVQIKYKKTGLVITFQMAS